MSVVKKQQLIKIFMIIALIIQGNALHAWGSNARNDPYPMYTSLDPQYFLYEREKQLLFGMADEKGTPESVMLSLSHLAKMQTLQKQLMQRIVQIPKLISVQQLAIIFSAAIALIPRRQHA